MQWQGDIVDKLSDNYIPLFIQAHAVYTILNAHIQIKKKKSNPNLFDLTNKFLNNILFGIT